MYKINKETNRIEKIAEKNFSELGFRERENLQEWLANNPSSLGEELLIIQKEFDGFNDTKERLDLLALDKQGNLVIIENKLDDTGRDVTWQVLKYASYCSSLSKTQIINIYNEYLIKNGCNFSAEESLSDFFNGIDIDELSLNNGITQRLILVAGNFRKEVTSTILWLLNYNLRIQCFKVTPYKYQDDLFLNFEQIIPIKEVEELSIRIAEKIQDDLSNQEKTKNRHIVRKEFWVELLKEMNKISKLFQNISPSTSNWIGTGSGISGIAYNFVITQKYARVELYIDKGDQYINEKIFKSLFDQKNIIEIEFGDNLVWEELKDKRACRIKYEKIDCNVFDKNDWDEMINFMTKSMIKFEKALSIPINKISKTNFLNSN